MALRTAASDSASATVKTWPTTGEQHSVKTSGRTCRSWPLCIDSMLPSCHRLTNLDLSALDCIDQFRCEEGAMTRSDGLRERVRERYAEAATTVLEGGESTSCCDSECGTVAGSGSASCCGPTVLEVDETFGGGLYSRGERDELPVAAVAASLGCGNPTAVAELREGERVLDLGSGGGIDVLLSARRVGPTGFAYGVDMTDEMLELARGNAAKAGAANVEFLKGTIEDVPLPDASIDVVISNCVINLSTD